jgi:DNA polymerase/3'-5' exonuclease PolX
VSNAAIADQLAGLAQLLIARKELAHEDADLTVFAGIGKAISQAIREIVYTGTLGRLEHLRSEVSPEIAALKDYPRLDPARVLRAYKKLGISSVEELAAKLESGEIEKAFGARFAQHIRQRMSPAQAILLHKAHELRSAVEDFLLNVCKVRRLKPWAVIGGGLKSSKNFHLLSRRHALIR